MVSCDARADRVGVTRSARASRLTDIIFFSRSNASVKATIGMITTWTCPRFCTIAGPHGGAWKNCWKCAEGSGLPCLNEDEVVEFGNLYRRTASDLNQAQTFVSGDATVAFSTIWWRGPICSSMAGPRSTCAAR